MHFRKDICILPKMIPPEHRKTKKTVRGGNKKLVILHIILYMHRRQILKIGFIFVFSSKLHCIYTYLLLFKVTLDCVHCTWYSVRQQIEIDKYCARRVVRIILRISGSIAPCLHPPPFVFPRDHIYSTPRNRLARKRLTIWWRKYRVPVDHTAGSLPLSNEGKRSVTLFTM